MLPRYQKGFVPAGDGAEIPYVVIGQGGEKVAIIPGAGDGLRTVTQAASQLGWFYRGRGRHHHLLVLSRRQPLPSGMTAEQHADDLILALERLNWGATVLECNSAGGPIGQWMAVKRPDLVRGLILSCTLHRTDEHTRGVLQRWAQLAREGKWAELNWSSIELTFRPATVARYRLARPLLRLIGKPGDPDRMINIFESLMMLDNRPILHRIQCPTLVIGGEDDRVIPAAIQREMAGLIPNSRLKMYPGYGHGNDQENPDYGVQVEQFLRSL